MLEEASRLQNLELQRMMGEERARAAHVQTLQRQNVQLTQSLEDVRDTLHSLSFLRAPALTSIASPAPTWTRGGAP